MTQYNIPQTAQTTLNSPAIPQNIQLQTLQQPQKIRNSLNQIQIIQNATPAFPNMAQILNQQKLNKTPMPLLTPQQSADSHFVRNFPIYEADPRRMQIIGNKRSSYDPSLVLNRERFGYNIAGNGIGANNPAIRNNINVPVGVGTGLNNINTNINNPNIGINGLNQLGKGVNNIGTGLNNLRTGNNTLNNLNNVGTGLNNVGNGLNNITTGVNSGLNNLKLGVNIIIQFYISFFFFF